MEIVTKIDGARVQLPRHVLGSVLKFSWISSGETITSNWLAIYNGPDALVGSQAATSSANGYTFADASVSTPGFYVAEWNVRVGANLYKRRDIFEAVTMEVD